MHSKKVSGNELEKIFKDYDNRSSFILNYVYFGKDDNAEYYKAFIDTNIFLGRKHKLQEHAIELSLAANIFHIIYLDVISKIIYSRRTARIKLLCLDWLNYFVTNIPPHLYHELNIIAKRSNNELLKAQSAINLLVVETNARLLTEALDILNVTTKPAVYYRYLNNLTDNDKLKNLYPDIGKELNNLIKHSTILSDSQKAELKCKLSA